MRNLSYISNRKPIDLLYAYSRIQRYPGLKGFHPSTMRRSFSSSKAFLERMEF